MVEERRCWQYEAAVALCFSARVPHNNELPRLACLFQKNVDSRGRLSSYLRQLAEFVMDRL